MHTEDTTQSTVAAIQPNAGVQRLNTALGRFSELEDVAAAIGIDDVYSQSSEFWTDQRRAARQRTYMLAEQRLGGDILTDRMTLSVELANVMAYEVDKMHFNEKLTYTEVRQWFLHRGQAEQNMALGLRRENAVIASTGLRVLLLLNAGGAKYLAYGPNPQDVHLVSNPADAHVFPLRRIRDLETEGLANMAQDFEVARKHFDAKVVKVLPFSRS